MLFHGWNGFLNGHAVEETGIYHDGAVVLGDKGLFCNIAAGDDLDNWQAELSGKLPVALVVAWNAHDDTCAVAHEHIVGNEHRHGLAGGGVRDLNTLKPYAGLILIQLPSLKVGLVGGGVLILLNLGDILYDALPLFKQRMLRGDDHICHAEEGVRSGGVDGYIVLGVGLEGELRAGGAAYPVLLLDLDALDVIQIVQIVDKALGVLGDGEHPLALLLADDLAPTALAYAVNDLFICKHALAAGAPVDGHGGLIGKTLLEHLEEYPLRPFIILGVSGIHRSVPVKAVAEHLELICEVDDVVLGYDGGVDMVLYGIILRGQAESVKPDGEQHIVALHALFPRDDVKRREGAGMPHVQPLPGGVRELDKPVELGLVAAGNGGIRLSLLPALLPFLLYRGKIIFHFNQILSSHASLRLFKAAAFSFRNAPVIRGAEGLRGGPPPHRSKGAQDYRIFWPHR